MWKYSQIRNRSYRALLLTFAIFLGIFIPLSPATANPTQNYIFLIDLSGSMNGVKLIEAKSALTSLVNSDLIKGEIAIIGFNTSSKILLEPSYDRKAAINVIASLQASGNTALFDGIETAINTATKLSNSTIIAITDGKDTSSKLQLNKIANLAAAYEGEIHFISIGKDLMLINDLNYIAGDKGSVTDVSNIVDLFQTLKPLIPANNTNLVVTKGVETKKLNSYIEWLYLFCISLLFMLMALAFLYRNRKARLSRLKLLQAYDNEETRLKMQQEKSLFFSLMRFKPFFTYVKNEEKRLLAAGISLDVRTWLYIQIGVFILANLFLSSLGLPFILDLFIAGFFGFGIGKIYLKNTRNRKARAFAEELPDTLTIIAGSLKSGLSFTQAIESVAKEGDNEVALQFRRVLAEVQLGRLLTDSLQDVAERMDSTDFSWTISALTIQRDVGGNLSEILSSTAETIRGRAEIRREIRALSAEGRMSAYVLVALPLLMMLYLQLTKPDYLKILFTQPIGIFMLVLVALLIIVGWIWVKRVVEVKLT